MDDWTANLPAPDYRSDDGSVVLYCGDCLDILPKLPDKCVDAVVTDPPYGVGLKAKTHKWFHTNGSGYDRLEDTGLFVQDVCVRAISICIALADATVFTPGPKHMFEYPRPDGWGVSFNPAGSGIGPWGFQCAQPLFFYGKCPYTANGLGNRPSSYRQSPSDYSVKCGHPCPKPMGLTTWMVERVSLPSTTILDPFMGSGTTGVACVKTGRKFIGIELSRNYFDIAVKRIEDAFADQGLWTGKVKGEQQLTLEDGDA